jgi:hypothetical protein
MPIAGSCDNPRDRMPLSDERAVSATENVACKATGAYARRLSRYASVFRRGKSWGWKHFLSHRKPSRIVNHDGAVIRQFGYAR